MKFQTKSGSTYEVNQADKLFRRVPDYTSASLEGDSTWKPYTEFFSWAAIANGQQGLLTIGQPAVFIFPSKQDGATLLTTSNVVCIIELDAEEVDLSDLSI